MSDENIITKEIKELTEAGPEIKCYFLIQECGGFIWRMNHDLADDRIPLPQDPKERKETVAAIDRDIERVREIQSYAVSKLGRFGFSPLDSESKPTEDYWKWYRWWDTYVKSLSQDEWNKLSDMIACKKDLSSYRPVGDWRTQPV